MALEEALNECTAALRALSADFKAKPGTTPAPGTTPTAAARPPGRPPGSTNKPKLGIAEVKTIAMKVMDEKGKPAALALMKKHGAAKLIDMDEKNYAAFIAAAEVLLNEDEVGTEAETEAETDDGL